MPQPQNDYKEFTKCPNCGGENFLAKSAEDEMIERGFAKEGFHFWLQRIEGAPVNQSIDAKLMIGTKIPTIQAFLDVCKDCGTVFTRRWDTGQTGKTVRMMGPPPVMGRN